MVIVVLKLYVTAMFLKLLKNFVFLMLSMFVEVELSMAGVSLITSHCIEPRVREYIKLES